MLILEDLKLIKDPGPFALAIKAGLSMVQFSSVRDELYNWKMDSFSRNLVNWNPTILREEFSSIIELVLLYAGELFS